MIALFWGLGFLLFAGLGALGMPTYTPAQTLMVAGVVLVIAGVSDMSEATRRKK